MARLFVLVLFFRGLGEVVRKVRHSSVRIENLLLALYGGTGYFSLARTFWTVWGALIEFGMDSDKSHRKDTSPPRWHVCPRS